MTAAPDIPRVPFADLASAVEALRRRGLRLTTPRRLVLEALFAAEGPVSAEHIATELKLDVTSAYRNLEALEHHGLARHVHLGHGPGLYALIGRGEREFLSCERCGAVRTLTREQLDPVRDQIRQLFGYEARFTHFAIVGLCPACVHEHRQPPEPASAQGSGQAVIEQTSQNANEHSHGHHIHSHPHSHRQDSTEQHQHNPGL